MSEFPDVRLRRLRKNDAIRKMLGQSMPRPEKFIWPVFVIEGSGKREPIAAMPGQFSVSVDMLCRELEPVVAMGIGGVLLFGVVDDDRKDAEGTYAYNENGLVQQAIIAVKKSFPDFPVHTDVCLCGYTDHGHCGLLKNDTVDNDPTIEVLGKIAVSHAVVGADCVAPSAMMDGQIRAIRHALSAANLDDTLLMSYSTKFGSAMYGPFRSAANSSPSCGNRLAYQASYNDVNQAMRESSMDEAEGADILMVKPALFYLDIIAKIKESTNLPLAAYNVSGEYAMLTATADREWGNLKAMVQESIMALSRAGTDIIISYWANQYDAVIKEDV